MRIADEVGLLDIPKGRGKVIVVVAQLIAVFEDGADFDAGQGKDLAVKLFVFGF